MLIPPEQRVVCRSGALPLPKRSGFAVIVALGIMGFLVLLMVGLATHLKVEIDAANSHIHTRVARENARLALQVALGELQRHAGRDARVTAKADLVESNPPDYTRQWLGVFRSDFTVSDRVLTATSQNGERLRWLVSGGERIAPDESIQEAISQFELVPIVNEYSYGGLVREAVQVPLVTESRGAYAFWIADENQKLNLNVADNTDNVRFNEATYQETRARLNSLGENYSDTDYDLQPSNPSGLVLGNGFYERERLRHLAVQVPYSGHLLQRLGSLTDPLVFEDYATSAASMSGNDVLLNEPFFSRAAMHQATASSASVLTNVPEDRLRLDLNDAARVSLEDMFGPLANTSDRRIYAVNSILSARHSPDHPAVNTHLAINAYRTRSGLEGEDVHAALLYATSETPYITEFGARFTAYIGNSTGAPVPEPIDPSEDYFLCISIEMEVELWNAIRMHQYFTSDVRIGSVGWPAIEVNLSNGSIPHQHIQLDHLMFHLLTNPYEADRSALSPVGEDRYMYFSLGDTSSLSFAPGGIEVWSTPGKVYQAEAGNKLYEDEVELNPARAGDDGYKISLVPNTAANPITFVLRDNPVTFTGTDPGDITVTVNSIHREEDIKDGFNPPYRGYTNNVSDIRKEVFSLFIGTPLNLRDKGHHYTQFMHPPGSGGDYTFRGSSDTYPAEDNSRMRWGFGWALKDNPQFYIKDFDLRRGAWHEPGAGEPEYRIPLNASFDSRDWKQDMSDNAGNRIAPAGESRQFFSAVGTDNAPVGLAIFDVPRQSPINLSALKSYEAPDLSKEGHFFGYPWGEDENRPFDSTFFSTLPRGIDGNESSATLDDIRTGQLPNTLMGPAFNTRNLPAPKLGFSGSREGDDTEISHDTITGMMRYDMAALYLMQEAGFNINSTSVEAWEGYLSGAQLRMGLHGSDRRLRIHGAGGSNVVASDLRHVHFTSPQNADNTTEVFSESDIETMSESPGNGSTSASQEFQRKVAFHQGVRILSADRIRSLAEAVVQGIKDHVRNERGGRPFTSVREFVNAGILENILDPATNSLSSNPNLPFYWDADNHYKYSMAYLSQADILTNISHFLTPRGDTFLVRVYGDARDAEGNVLARSYGEALVQRLPDPVDSLNLPPDPTDDQIVAVSNQLNGIEHPFGRRFQVISFHWLQD